MKLILTLFIYLGLMNIAISGPINGFIAQYDLYHNEFYVGQTKRTLVKENKILTFSSTAETMGLAALFADVKIKETSKLRFKNEQLNFFSYSFHEKKNDENFSYQLRLDKKNTFFNTYKKQNYPVTKNLHDALGFTVAIMQDMQDGKRNIEYTIADKKKIKTYSLNFLKKERLTTESGYVDTLKIEHYDPQKKVRFTFWCAEKMGFLPVRIKNLNSKGDENLLSLTHFNNKQVKLVLEGEEAI